MKRTLLNTNPYLKDPSQRKRLFRRSLVSSFAVEGISLDKEVTNIVKEKTPAFTYRKALISEQSL